MNRLFNFLSFFILPAIMITAYTSWSQLNQDYFSEKYSGIAEKIAKAAQSDTSAWNALAYMCDTFGHRLSGSENLENAIKWLTEAMSQDGLANVKAEDVMVPHWVRGKEYCELLSPWKSHLDILGLGESIGTPKEGITAPLLVVSDFDELKEKAAQAKGKIVLFDEVFKNYGQAVQYRFNGAVEAAKVGAVACLVRSVSPIGMHNPHTGSMGYDDSVKKIPAAALTLEDAEMLHRMQDRGQTPMIHLYMEAETLPDAPSHNVMCELPGSEKPDEILAIGGHIDSWDVGTGAHDDASGVIATWKAVKLLKDLGLKPRRTIRAVAWVNEENGLRGGRRYAELHKQEKHVLMFEFDSGVFAPGEIGFSGNDTLYNIVESFEPLLNKIDKIKVTKEGHGVDISPMVKLGIPAMSLNTEDEGKYFWYHHSPADTPDKVDPAELNKCIAAIALAVYLYADLPVDLLGSAH